MRHFWKHPWRNRHTHMPDLVLQHTDMAPVQVGHINPPRDTIRQVCIEQSLGVDITLNDKL